MRITLLLAGFVCNRSYPHAGVFPVIGIGKTEMTNSTLVYDRIRQAMLNGNPIAVTYHGHRRLVCPHVLGTKKGLHHVLTFQYGGGSKSGLPPGGEWRCMMVGNIYEVEELSGPWRTDQNHNRAQTCVDQVDVELWVDPAGKPYIKRA